MNANPYTPQAHAVARRALGAWNRDPASPAAGSFDRPWWAWKFRDFSDSTLQNAARLAIEYARDHGLTAELPGLLDDWVAFLERVQHRDGSFDQCYPYERAPGVLYDFLSTLVFVARSGHLRPETRARLDTLTRRAVDFALGVEETHGEIANHIAQYAAELYDYAAWSGDGRARARADAYIDRLMALFDREEGWFNEYNGADPGYQTRCLRYVVKCAELTGNEALWDAAGRAARFVWQMLMPDGSLHPMLGCRSTALVYPWAIERLAQRDPALAGLAALVRQGWAQGRVPLPSSLDFVNAVRLADDALDAGRLVASGVPGAPAAMPPHQDVVLPRAGIAIRRRADSALWVAGHVGGAGVLYRRDSDGAWRLAWEDSGYVLAAGRRRWLTRSASSGARLEASPDRVVVRAPFARGLHDELDPGRLIVLRLLNLTVLRVQWLADLFRRLVVRRLIVNDAGLPATLVRTLAVDGDRLVVSDRFEVSGAVPDGSLYRCRRTVSGHMVSARYFQDQELQPLPLPWTQRLDAGLAGGGPPDTVIDLENT